MFTIDSSFYMSLYISVSLSVFLPCWRINVFNNLYTTIHILGLAEFLYNSAWDKSREASSPSSLNTALRQTDEQTDRHRAIA